MFIKPFGPILESPKPSLLDTYIGVVSDNNDPKKLGRVKVLIPLFEDMEPDSYPWAYPLLSTFLGNSPNAVSFNVPEIGSQVRVSFPTKDIYAPYYSGCEMNEENKCTFFDEDYPNCYGSKDSRGNFIKVNKKTDKTTIQHSSTTNVEVTQDGTVTLTNPNGSSIMFDSGDNLTIDSVKELQVDATSVTAQAGQVTLGFDSTTFTGDVNIYGSLNPANGANAIIPLPNGKIMVFTNGILTGVFPA